MFVVFLANLTDFLSKFLNPESKIPLKNSRNLPGIIEFFRNISITPHLPSANKNHSIFQLEK
jgi:hypothetical protein